MSDKLFSNIKCLDSFSRKFGLSHRNFGRPEARYFQIFFNFSHKNCLLFIDRASKCQMIVVEANENVSLGGFSFKK